MKKTILTILSYVLVAAVAASTALLCVVLTQKQNTGKLEQVENLLLECYIGETDKKAMEDAAASAMVNAIGDRWSYYMTAEQYQSYKDTMSNSYVGVGITVQARQDCQGIEIAEITAGGSAEEAGVLTGDVILAVDGTDIVGKPLTEIAALIKGTEGTTVTLTIDRAGERKTFTLTRRKIDTVVATYEMLDGDIGLITIENFDDRCADETIDAIEALREQGAMALIFDVRNNPGGYKHELVELLDYLLPEGEIFRTEDYRGRTQVDRSDAKCLDMPMAVLMNLNSYSAAEFFAAALDEYDAAVTVGERTFGKGYFQTTFSFSDGSAVNLSIGKYYTPKGASLAGVGLTPDIPVEVDERTAAKIAAGILEPEEDPQILAAINALKN